MTIAYVLINVTPGHEQEVYAELIELTEIIEADLLFGEHDIIAKVEMSSPDDLSTIVLEGIRHIKYVIETKSLTTFSFPEK